MYKKKIASSKHDMEGDNESTSEAHLLSADHNSTSTGIIKKETTIEL